MGHRIFRADNTKAEEVYRKRPYSFETSGINNASSESSFALQRFIYYFVAVT